jgi:lipoprotein-anchoring transpeptidase ErfK/SrfK
MPPHPLPDVRVLALSSPEQRAVENYPVASPFPVDRDLFVLVDKGQHILTLYRRVKTVPVAIGKRTGDKQTVGDCRTPECAPDTVFPIQTKLHTPGESQFGPRYLELSTPKWTGIAVHGTNAPRSVGTDASHGCVRLYNQDITWLSDQVHIGDPVLIRR